MDRTELYRDIAERTGGDIYIGVVGPVRTGKSTFIKRFMELLVLPGMEDVFAQERATDELPQSAAGRTIMTTQPKFVPNEAAEISVAGSGSVKVRLVDCVGYMIPGAVGHIEDGNPRMVRTPWHDYDIPFEEAAEIGTKKVITEHSTIGLVLTTDGSITDIARENYEEAEERVIRELKEHKKPFAVILNSVHPESPETKRIAEKLQEKYDAAVLCTDIMHLSAADLHALMELVLAEFPMRTVHISVPGWIGSLSEDHWLISKILSPIREIPATVSKMRDHTAVLEAISDLEGFLPPTVRKVNLGTGAIELDLHPESALFYSVLSEMCGYEVHDDAHLIASIRDFVTAKREYDRLKGALDAAYQTGYGMVPPKTDAIELDTPEIMQQGSRYGVRLRASSAGLHLIRIDIDTELSPIVGTEEQAKEFLRYLSDAAKEGGEGIWSATIFGKPLYELVREGMAGKVNGLPEDVQQRLQETLQRMVNEGCNGLVCILL